jgi:hypothetical protein
LNGSHQLRHTVNNSWPIQQNGSEPAAGTGSLGGVFTEAVTNSQKLSPIIVINLTGNFAVNPGPYAGKCEELTGL